MAKTLLILGGYGNTGKLIANLLLEIRKDTSIVLAGRNLAEAQKETDRLNQAFEGHRVFARQVDASSATSLQAALSDDVDVLVVASSTTALTQQVMQAAIDVNVDYYDIQYSDSHRLEVLESLKSDIESSGKTFVVEGGFHPGVPAALVRYAATQLDHVVEADVYGNISENWKEVHVRKETEEEFFGQMTEMKSDIYSNGKWEAQGWQVVRDYEFAEPFHKRACAPMFLNELRSLPTLLPSLEHVGFWITGFDPVSTFVALPLSLGVSALFPKTMTKPMARFFTWSLKTFSRPPYGTMLALEAHDARKEKQQNPSKLHVTIGHQDSYFLTAVAAVAGLLQLLDDDTKTTPGLHCQAHFVDPERFVSDLERLGLNVTIKKTT
ncbi:saccharopine dehydrogenase [Seminavis robusta]|uniref:Saccharopine dehydrogenase n=1 Tax=Seminavis robusta TaxID=568900 RepID=A0A9N8D5Y8_9STRA|nr:saccharopine dehydrogenase [Seminavis robusta]|eukprot:Sro13_g009860.1 saccharopine dehydrogenase (381) ;mRNA; f:49958-51100